MMNFGSILLMLVSVGTIFYASNEFLSGNTVSLRGGRRLLQDPRSITTKPDYAQLNNAMNRDCPAAYRFPLELEPVADFEALPGSWVLNEKVLPGRKEASWNMYYKLVCDFIEAHVASTKNLRIVEIGTAYGGNANALAERFSSATIVAVDPLLAGYDKGDMHSNNLVRWAESHGNSLDEFSMGWAQGLLREQRSKYGCRYHLVKALSTEAGNAFMHANILKFDVAFIDGLHTYEGVKADIEVFVQLVKPGGILIFNDYGASNFPGVKQAVDEFVSALGGGGSLVVGGRGVAPGLTNAAIVLPLTRR